MDKQPQQSPVENKEESKKIEEKIAMPDQKVKLLLLLAAFVFASWQVGLLLSELASGANGQNRSGQESGIQPGELEARPPLIPAEKDHDRPAAEEARFTPNPAFETLINGEIRSRVLDLTVESPLPEAILYPNHGGLVPLEFSGRITETEKTFTSSFRILIFGNRDVDQELYSFFFRFKENAESKNSFRVSRKLRIAPGLYYFLVQSEEGEQLLHTGKFTVMKKVGN